MNPEMSSTTSAGPADLASAQGNAIAAPCPECASRSLPREQYVYGIGRLDVRFPSLGIEREYQQRERAMEDLQDLPRNARVGAVLGKNAHLAMRVSYVFQIGGTPIFALSPTSGFLKDALFTALSKSDEPDHVCVVIGRVGSFAAPPSYGGLLLSAVLVDQLYTFSLHEWAEGLTKIAQPALKSRNIDAKHFRVVSENIFRDVSAMPENIGSADGHRALNYLLVQHPGMFLAAAERKNSVLDHMDTRVIQTLGGRRHVAVILTFLDRGTGVPERLYCTVDVTEEWPFVVSADGAASPLGLAPFVDNVLYTSV